MCIRDSTYPTQNPRNPDISTSLEGVGDSTDSAQHPLEGELETSQEDYDSSERIVSGDYINRSQSDEDGDGSLNHPHYMYLILVLVHSHLSILWAVL